MRSRAAAWLLVVCCLASDIAFSGQEDADDKTTDSKKIAWMRKGMEAVRQKLKDPRSAEFRNVFFNQGSKNVPDTGGEVNSKNAFGGFTGFQRFISAGQTDLTYLEEEVDGFPDVWRHLCQ
jgi:hypothetical protein